LIRVPIPELSQERRAELAKVAARYAEAARVAVRNVRRDGMEQLKRQEKDGDLSQDAHHKISHQVQELTDSEIKQINDMLAAKESEIMTI
ncbi:MAG: ribosome recycling factor, partial [Geminicoccaceae bacterium]|nr:ribosome recycling factor [Geminicoccaceae bacterium]